MGVFSSDYSFFITSKWFSDGGHSKSDFCQIHTNLVSDGSAESKITEVEFKYFAIDIYKTFEQSFSTCNSKEHLQMVVLSLHCNGMIGYLLDL